MLGTWLTWLTGPREASRAKFNLEGFSQISSSFINLKILPKVCMYLPVKSSPNSSILKKWVIMKKWK